MEELECKGTTHTISFTASQAVTLHGIVVYGCLEGSALYQVRVEIIKQNKPSRTDTDRTKSPKGKQSESVHMGSLKKTLDFGGSCSETDSYKNPETVTYVSLATERTVHTYDVMLSKPVKVDAGIHYRIVIEMDGPPTKLGFHGKGESSSAGVMFQFYGHKPSLTNVERGQIPGLLFTLLKTSEKNK